MRLLTAVKFLVVPVLMAVAVAAPTPAPAQAEVPAPDDRHLPVVPLSDTDAARVAALLGTPLSAGVDRFEAQSGGAATVRPAADANAFSKSSANMEFARELDFKLGNGLFRKTWVAAPASTRASDGLGPVYNARACQDCHLKDGRGHTPTDPSDGRVSMFLRLSVPAGPDPASGNTGAIRDYLATAPDPVYGGQLQDFAAPGQKAEGRMEVTYDPLPVTFADGTVVTLRAPRYAIGDPAYGPPSPGLMLSPRVAPQMIGLGLLEAIPSAGILALADPQDADGDGISGRPNIVMSREFGVPMLGRFGWKAGTATVRQQSADAFSGDMGLSTVLNPDPWGECTAAQAACRSAPHGQEPGLRDGLEVDGQSLDLVTFYARNLGVPARRTVDDPQVLQGKALFGQAKCAACHVPRFVTNRLEGQPEQSFQLIWPYTDLLLHDMGPGLADDRPEGLASGREWRTPPLWGIGLTQAVSGHTQFLHDGRARNLTEAILWHGGEAQPSRDMFLAMPAPDRAALLSFLESL